VLDFGIASMAIDEGGDATLTKDGTVLGSPAYMSPEQLKNPHNVDARTDVYAFGVILYEALAGSRPFRSANYGALIIAIESLIPKPLSQVRTDLPDGLEPVVLRAFSREPAARHPDVLSLINALQPFRRR
jgi:serine/threonine protein kinase